MGAFILGKPGEALQDIHLSRPQNTLRGLTGVPKGSGVPLEDAQSTAAAPRSFSSGQDPEAGMGDQGLCPVP